MGPLKQVLGAGDSSRAPRQVLTAGAGRADVYAREITRLTHRILGGKLLKMRRAGR